MREQFVYIAGKGAAYSEWLRQEPATIYEGIVTDVTIPGFKVAASYQDGCMHNWVLLVSTKDSSLLTHILCPEAVYLPIYITTSAHDFVDLLKYLETTLYCVETDEDFSN